MVAPSLEGCQLLVLALLDVCIPFSFLLLLLFLFKELRLDFEFSCNGFGLLLSFRFFGFSLQLLFLLLLLLLLLLLSQFPRFRHFRLKTLDRVAVFAIWKVRKLGVEKVHPFGQIVPIHERGLLHDAVILRKKKF